MRVATREDGCHGCVRMVQGETSFHDAYLTCDKRPGMANLKSFPFPVAPARCFEPCDVATQEDLDDCCG